MELAEEEVADADTGDKVDATGKAKAVKRKKSRVRAQLSSKPDDHQVSNMLYVYMSTSVKNMYCHHCKALQSN